jgi:Fe2+ or Zn2+ uptake regulation protein
MLCEEKDKEPRELLQECLNELEEKGFLNCLENEADNYLYKIRDQRDKLRHFISGLLKQSQKGLSFDNIHKKVSNTFQNFYTKDFVFKVIDELFQMGLIYEVSKQTYMFHDYNMGINN